MVLNKIWHISDTHTFHRQLNPPDADIVIFSGDCSNPRDKYISEREIRDFIDWYATLNIPNKIFVAGNHDIAIERNLVTPEDFFENGILYLENDAVTINGLKIWGSPFTPTFGTGWAFNKDRGKIDNIWSNIPDDTDILVTHGPAKGILDLSYNIDGVLEYCGCKALRRNIFRVKPKLFCFGHVHDNVDCFNAGYTKIAGLDTIFSNGSVVMDARFEYGAVHNGNIFEL